MTRRIAGLTVLLIWCATAFAQEYPTRPIRLVVGFVPGGGADRAARSVATKLNEAWGQPVVVDNRAGAGGNIAAEIVARAVPDAYTLLVSSPGPIAINPALYPKLPYDAQKDFAPITLIAAGPNVLVLYPGTPASNVQELIALARSKPGGLNFASSGIGTTPHLSGELFNLAAKVKMVHVAYKSAGPAVIDVVAGRVDLMLVSVPSVLTQIRAHRLKALAVTSLKRSSVLPDLPTLDESGLPGFDVTVWWGLLATGGSPRDRIAKLNAAVVKSLTTGDTRERLAAEGADVVADTPTEFGNFLRKEMTKWAQVIKLAGIKKN